MYLAQFNITRLKYPLDAPEMKGFVDGIDFIHSIADRMGLVHRVKGENGNATGIKVLDDPLIIPNLSVWPDIDTLKKFVYNTVHKKYINRRDEWFLPETEIQNVFWWIPEDHRPEMSEGEERFKYFRKHGATEYAFDWSWIK
jgi:hypothetical protein